MWRINLTMIIFLFLTVESLSGRSIRRKRLRRPALEREYDIENSIDTLATKLENHATKIENIESHLSEFSEAFEQQAFHLERLHYRIGDLVAEVTKELYMEGYTETSKQTSERELEDELLEKNQQNFAENNEKEVDEMEHEYVSEVKKDEIEEFGNEETEEIETFDKEGKSKIPETKHEHFNSQEVPLIDDDHDYYESEIPDHQGETVEREKEQYESNHEEDDLEYNQVPEYRSFPSSDKDDDDLLPNRKAKLISDDM